MAIVGFFGFPLADMVLRTYKLPSDLFREGAPVTNSEVEPPRLSSFIARLDSWMKNREQSIRTHHPL